MDALSSVAGAWEAGTRYYDTAPWYGKGLSEQRLGLGLHNYPREEYHVTTKVGRYLRPVGREGAVDANMGPNTLRMNVEFSYSGDSFRRQHADSLQRLGCGYIDALVIHDMEQSVQPEGNPHGLSLEQHKAALFGTHPRSSDAGGFAELQQMRAEGVIDAFGAGINVDSGSTQERQDFNREYCAELITHDRANPIDFLNIAGGYNLLCQDAWNDGTLALCEEVGVSVVICWPFASGMLAGGDPAAEGAKPRYIGGPASPEMIQTASRMNAICERHGVSLAAAALQFPLAHPNVTTTVPGALNAKEAKECGAWFKEEIPAAVWEEFKSEGLLPADVPTPA